MRIAVCNRYWGTAGGGESYALGIAAALAGLGRVDLLGPPGVDWPQLFERLRVEPEAEARAVDMDDAAAVAAVSRDYDLFVNVSWAASFVSLARRSVLVVHFPFRIVEREAHPAKRALTALAAGTGVAVRDGGVTYGEGFHAPEGGVRPYRWTDGDGELLLWLPRRETDVEVVFAGGRPWPAVARVLVEGAERAAAEVGPADGAVAVFRMAGRADGLPYRVRVQSDSFNPADQLGAGDDRRLGVPVREVRLAGGAVGRVLGRTAALAPARRAPWLPSYDVMVANSRYTAKWVWRWWGRRSKVVHPPVVPRRSGAKEQMVLSVGRFFPPDRGHSKRQLEMVRSFGRAVASGLRGWELHLVGGCQPEDRAYLRTVEEAAAGLPVHLHLDAGGAELDDLYGRAAVYWHATGLGQDLRQRPEAAEHFGIAVVEAMSAGAVPLVAGVGGPAETVRDGRDGYHVGDFDGFTARTSELAAAPDLLARLSQSAERRARDYAPDAFGTRLRSVVEPLLGD